MVFEGMIEQSERDREALARKTRQAILWLVSRRKPAYLPRVEGALARLSGGEGVPFAPLLHPDVFRWYFGLSQKAKGEDGDALGKHLERVSVLEQTVRSSRLRARENLGVIGAAIDVDVGSEGAKATLDRGIETLHKAVGRSKVHIVPAPGPQVLGVLRGAFDLVREVWPEAYAETHDSLQKLVIFRGDALISYTDFKYHGSVFLGYEETAQTEDSVTMADELVHEAAHVRLNTALVVDPHFRNDVAERYSSPLRREPRSMFGVFHQAFALSRLTQFYARLEDKYPGQTAEDLARVAGDLRQALAIIERHAQLTDRGESFLDDARDLAHRVKGC